MSLFALTAATDTTTNAAGSSIGMIIMIVVMIAVMYFFMIRPQKKQERETNEMRNSLKVGDEITTIGGVIGAVVSIHEESQTLVIETSADKVRIEFTKWAVSSNNTAEKAAAKAKEAAVAARKASKKEKK